MTAAWRRTSAVGAALAAGLGALLIGVATGRADIAVLGAAPVVASAWALARRPVAGSEVTLREIDGTGGASGQLGADVGIAAPVDATAVRVRVGRPGSTSAHVLMQVDGERALGVRLGTIRTGTLDVVRVDLQAVGAGFAHLGQPRSVAPHRITILPATRALATLPLPFRLRGLTGAHESRRPGDGGGLRDVHPFVPGDRLRRIDWRVTARRSPDLSELYVRRTFALADAVVMLVVDSRDDVGPDPATWSGADPVRPQDVTSMDLARQAAASIARQVVAVGDRVGLDDLGVRRRPVPPGGGRRHLDRIVHTLALTTPDGDPGQRRRRPPQIPSGALVVVFSTFLDDDAAQAARWWRHAGHRVVAVDVLPHVRDDALIHRERLALRMVRIERADRLAELAASGVELMRWGDGDPAVELARLARRSHHHAGAEVGR